MIAPALPVAIPLFTAALLAGLNHLIPRRASAAIAIAVAAATVWLNWTLLLRSSAAPVVYWFGGWQPRQGAAIGICFEIDPFGAGLALLGAVLVLAALIYSSRYFETVGNIYHVLMLAFLAAMCGFSLTGDLFNMFVFFELMGAAAFALCGYKSEDPGSLQGALNFAVTNTIGAFVVLSGIALLYGRTGALNMAQIGNSMGNRANGLAIVAFVFITAGYSVKAAVAPFHFWLPDAHAVAPTPVCILFSGVMVELGLYAVARIYWTIFSGTIGTHQAALRNVLIVSGTITALLGAGMCYAQRHIKRLLAFSTVSHMGIMTIGFAFLNPDGLAGTAVYVLGHGFIKASLFLSAGLLLHRTGKVDEIDLHGNCRKLPWIAVLFVAGAIGLAGCPGFGTFEGARLIELTARQSGFAWIESVTFIAGTVTAAAVLRMTGRVFFGWGPAQDAFPHRGSRVEEQTDTNSGHDRTPATMYLPAAALLLLGLPAAAPALPGAARRVAAWFEDRPAYAAHVLHNLAPAITPVSIHMPDAADYSRGFAGVLAAAGLALLTLFAPRLRAAFAGSRAVQTIVREARRLHSGVIPDYVTWLVVGIAALGFVSAMYL